MTQLEKQALIEQQRITITEPIENSPIFGKGIDDDDPMKHLHIALARVKEAEMMNSDDRLDVAFSAITASLSAQVQAIESQWNEWSEATKRIMAHYAATDKRNQ